MVAAAPASESATETAAAPISLGGIFDRVLSQEWDPSEVDQALLESAAEEFTFATAVGKDDTWSGVTLELLRSSCAMFASEILESTNQDPPYHGKFLIADHHMEWDDLVTTKKRLCVLAPRDHGKTFFFDFAYPIWKAAFLPNGIGYIFSATQDQAIRILADIKEQIESNPKLAWLMPKDKRRSWNKTQIVLANGHKIFARGYGTKIRGAHPNWIVVDDGLNDEDGYSELVRQKHIDYFLTAITNMCVPGGQIIVVGTPFHAADLYAKLSENEVYCFRKYAAIKPDGTALWPERYCLTDEDQLALEAAGLLVTSLETRSKEIGTIKFTREFLCQPISDEMSLFPKTLFEGTPVQQLHVVMGQSRAYYEQLGINSFFVGFDLAIASSAGSDWTVGFVLGVDDAENRWVVDIQRHQGKPYDQQKSLINALGRKYDADIIYLESNQMQRIWGDELIRETSLPIRKFITSGMKKNNNKQPTGNTHTMNKNTLEGGVPQLRVLLENGKVRIPVGDQASIEKMERWVTEMNAFTWLDGKLQGVGTHDDTVMAFWIANCAVRAGAFTFSTGEGDDDNKSMQEILEAQMAEDPEDHVDHSVDPMAVWLQVFGDEKSAKKKQKGVHPAVAIAVDDDEEEGPLRTDIFGNPLDEDGDEDEDENPLSDLWSQLPGLNRAF